MPRSTSKSRESDNIFITSPASASQESADLELMKTVKEMSIAVCSFDFSNIIIIHITS
jgi:hypothetical protein